MEETRHRLADKAFYENDYIVKMDEEARKGKPPESCL